MNRYYSLPLALCVCLFIGCGDIDENQPARLISTAPAEGEAIEHDSLIHLYFDKPVTGVGVNFHSARNKHGKPSAAAWEIEASLLKLWKLTSAGYQPEELVELNIAFKDDLGWHSETLNVRVPAIIVPTPDPPKIIGGNVTHGAEDVDPERLNTHGIQITFNEPLQASTVVLRPKDGAPLNWRVEWEDRKVHLYPSDGDRLQYGTEYILELIGVKDIAGNESDFEIRFTTKE